MGSEVPPGAEEPWQQGTKASAGAGSGSAAARRGPFACAAETGCLRASAGWLRGAGVYKGCSCLGEPIVLSPSGHRGDCAGLGATPQRWVSRPAIEADNCLETAI